MRRAISEQPKWILDKDSNVIGLSLGGDHCAEHEWGIKKLQTRFDINTDMIGIGRHTCRAFPVFIEKQGTYEKKPCKIFVVSKYAKEGTLRSLMEYCQLFPYTSIAKRSTPTVPIAYGNHGLMTLEDDNLHTTWDEGAFAILAYDNDAINRLNLFIQFYKSNDMCIMYGGKRVFAPGTLSMIAASAIPTAMKKAMRAEDEDAVKLFMAVKKTRIEKLLKNANKGYYALAPKWANEMKLDENRTTKYPVIFFLNPHEQSKYNYGWFTVEELKLWAKDTGPIVKNN